jgi:hypothetical protein
MPGVDAYVYPASGATCDTRAAPAEGDAPPAAMDAGADPGDAAAAAQGQGAPGGSAGAADVEEDPDQEFEASGAPPMHPAGGGCEGR